MAFKRVSYFKISDYDFKKSTYLLNKYHFLVLDNNE